MKKLREIIQLLDELIDRICFWLKNRFRMIYA